MTTLTVPLAEVLAEVNAREAAPKSKRRPGFIPDSRSEVMTGDLLMREIRGAIMSVPHARRLAAGPNGLLTAEGEAIAQAVAVSVLAGREGIGWRVPRDLLPLADRYADRADLAGIGRVLRAADRRHTAARAAVCERGDIGRRFLADRVRSIIAQRADWQDLASKHRTRQQAARNTGPMVEAVGIVDDTATGFLAASAAAPSVEVEPADVPDLARAVGARVCPSDPVGARCVASRLVQAMAVSGGTDPVRALTDLAQGQGRSLRAIRKDTDRGANLLAEVDPADLLALVRDVARAEGLARSARWDRLDLTAGQSAAARAVEALARKGGAWDAASIRSGRSLPSWPEVLPMPDAAPFPALRNPAQDAPASTAARGPIRGPGHPVTVPPAPHGVTPLESVDALYLRAW